jgi:hypothetical protein
MSYDIVPQPSVPRILRLHCAGEFDRGGQAIRDFGADTLRETGADAVLLDFAHLHYTSGDELLMAFDIPHFTGDQPGGRPLAVLLGPYCQPAVQTLLEQEAGFTSWHDAKFVFTDEALAIEWLSREATSHA